MALVIIQTKNHKNRSNNNSLSQQTKKRWVILLFLFNRIKIFSFEKCPLSALVLTSCTERPWLVGVDATPYLLLFSVVCFAFTSSLHPSILVRKKLDEIWRCICLSLNKKVHISNKYKYVVGMFIRSACPIIQSIITSHEQCWIIWQTFVNNMWCQIENHQKIPTKFVFV